MNLRARAAVSFAAMAWIVANLGTPAFAAKEPDPIEVFNGVVQVVTTPRTGTGRIKIRILRWSTDEERVALRDELAKGGSDGLVSAMEKIEPVAYIQIDMELRHAIRIASTWQTEKGRMVRLATDRPIGGREAMANTRSMDYPIGIIEFLLPPEGVGEGTLIGAVRAQFDKDGRLEVESLPQNTGPQRITMIEKEQPKKKKAKK